MVLPMLVAAAVIVGCVVYGWFEAGWLRTRVVEVPVPGLVSRLDGVRIGHLSDFHLGAPFSRGNRATAKAVKWVAARRPDLVCVSGDLVSRPCGEPLLRDLVALLDEPLVVLGNHDVAVTRDPFSRAAELRDLDSTRLLGDESVASHVRDVDVCVVGVDPNTYRSKQARPHELVDPGAQLRVLLCHFPGIADRTPPESFDLILTGHLHGGQICVPLPGRRVTLAHPRARYVAGLYHTPAGTMHVSPGTGTTFVPFRFFSRPEVTEIVLRRRD